MTTPAPSSDLLKEKRRVTRVEVIESSLCEAVAATTSPLRREPANNDDDDDDGGLTSIGSAHETTNATSSSTKRPNSSTVSIFRFGCVASGSNGVRGSESVDRSRQMPQRDEEGKARSDDQPIEPHNDENCSLEIASEAPRDSEVASSGNQDEDDSRNTSFDPGFAEDDSTSPLPAQSQSARTDWPASHPRIPVSRSSAFERRQQPQESASRLSYKSVDSHVVTSGLWVSRGGQSGQEELLHAEPLRTPLMIPSPSKGTSPARSRKVEEVSVVGDSRVPATVRAATVVRAVAKTPPTHSIFAFTPDSSDDREQRARSVEFGGGADEQERDSLREPCACDQQDHAACDTRASTCSPLTDELPVESPSPVHRSLDSDTRRSSSFAGFDQAPCSSQSASLVADCPPQEVTKKSARDRVRSKLGAKVWWELEYTARRLEQEAAQPQRQHKGSSLRLTDTGQQCNERSSANQQAPKPISVPTVEREAAPECVKTPSPKRVVESVLEAITEEHSTPSSPVHSMALVRGPGHTPSDKTLPRSAAGIYMSESQEGACGNSIDTQVCSGTSDVRSSRNARVEQPASGRPAVANCARTDAPKIENHRTASSPKMKAWTTGAEAAKVSMPPSTSDAAKSDESSSRPVDRPSGSSKPAPHSAAVS